jgi:uncharacterized protein YfaS (alpha-2-macroglobulin family)
MKQNICLTMIAAVVLSACIARNKTIENNEKAPIIMQREKVHYADKWAEIEALREQGLPQSMQPIIDTVYQAALAEKNSEELLKAIIYQLNNIGLLKENEEGANRIFTMLKTDAETIPQAAKSIVYSMIAQMYEEYYNRRYWMISQRTTAAVDKADIHTWDTRSLAEESIKYYLLSLADQTALQNEPIDRYREILIKGYDSAYQPTLYDLLAKRALAYFESNFNVHSLLQETFVVNDPAYFADARTFIKQPVETTDTLSPSYLALKTYRDLLRFHIKRSGYDALFGKANDGMTALIDADLRRVAFVRSTGRYADTDQLYENALLEMSRNYKDTPDNASVLLQLGNFYFNKGLTWRNTKQDNDKDGYWKAYRICEQIEKDYPGQQTHNVGSLKASILRKELELQAESAQLPGKPFLALLKFRNISELYGRTYELTEQQVIEYHRSINRYSSNKDAFAHYLDTLKQMPEIRHIQLPESSDFQYYTTEISIEPLKKGYYLIVFSDASDLFRDSEIRTSLLIQASPLMVYDRTIEGVSTAVVTDRTNGAPLSGAKITFYSNNQKQASFVTKQDGTGSSSTTHEYHNPYYTVEHNGNRLLTFNPSYNSYRFQQETWDNAVIFTDRSIYRPGQTVYFKAILARFKSLNGPSLVSRKSVTVRLYDANWQVISEKRLMSNDFGSIDGYFTIPQGLLNGNMTIQCDEYGATSIRVEEYKRPTFEVKFDSIRDNYALNDEVHATGQAKALAGYAIDHAKVQYRIVRRMMYRYYHWWFPPLRENDREIGSGVLQTDEKGMFAIDFKALADDVEDDSKIYTYVVTADITDVNGETHSASVDVRIGNKPLFIYTNMPDDVTFENRNGYTVETTNLNGSFTPADVKIEISALKQPDRILRNRIWNNVQIDVHTIPQDEFHRNFPLDAYGDELNPSHFEVLQTIAQYTLDTETNKKLDLSALDQSGYYKVKLTADNRKGLVVEHERYVCFSGEKPGAISNMNQWIRAVKTTGEPGENVEIRLAGGQENTQVYCELIHRSEVIEAKWIKIGVVPTTITYPIKESHRGGFILQFSMIQQNRRYAQSIPVTVPYTNKMLDVKLSTFRDRLLPGEKETWTMKVTDKDGAGAQAEVVASLYDASLDYFNMHRFPDLSSFYFGHPSAYPYKWNFNAIERLHTGETVNNQPDILGQQRILRANVNWMDATFRNAFRVNTYGSAGMVLRSRVAANTEVISDDETVVEIVEEDELATSTDVNKSTSVVAFGRQKETVKKEVSVAGAGRIAQDAGLDDSKDRTDLAAVETRTNFNETAFFYPALRTNAEGEVLIEFTIPEALTRWKLLSFAHTQDLKVGTYTNALITRKQVAVSANPPRFFRENDVIELTAKVNNLTETDLKGQALLRLYDAVTMEPVDDIIRSEKTLPFDVRINGSVGLRWKLVIPEGLQAITYKLTAQAGTHTDGEEKTVPVLTNSMSVIETMPFSVRAGKEKHLTFDRLIHNKSKTLRHHSLTLEYTSAPAWYAVQSLPYIMEYPYECAEQTFARYYANTLATTIVQKTPRIKQLFDQWNMQGVGSMLSNLEKNQELKQIMLEETPWVLQAKNESERKKRMGLLFDLNRMSAEQNRAFHKLKNVQDSNGGFPWFDGNPPSRYITQHIVAGIAHLIKLDAIQANHTSEAPAMVERGLTYLDQAIYEDYHLLLERKADLEKQQIGALQLHYLYACSFSEHRPTGAHQTAFDYYLQQAGQHWKQFSTCEKAMAALVLHRYQQPEKAQAILRSLKEHAQQTEEMGMYWKDNVAGYFWYQAPIETQAMLIEAFNEVTQDETSVEEMKIWLLRNKQTNDWKTTKATSEAIYALLMTGGSNLLDETRPLEVEISDRPLSEVAKEPVTPQAGTGYVKTSWQGADVTPRMGTLKVKNPHQKGIAWGGMYWQYFERLDQITSTETNLRMTKQLFLRTLTDKGEVLLPIDDADTLHNEDRSGSRQGSLASGKRNASANALRVGDLVRVRMELRADRDYEYVHLKDMRASGFEPVSTRSGHRYQDGLWYYESVKDASTNFFITYLRKGSYVFEYDLRVSHVGDFSNGITTFQCMYAPEFSAHSEGARVTIVAPE